jgi:hypothetical protein
MPPWVNWISLRKLLSSNSKLLCGAWCFQRMKSFEKRNDASYLKGVKIERRYLNMILRRRERIHSYCSKHISKNYYFKIIPGKR